MLGVSTIERLEKLARKGDLRRIDLSVRDIAGGSIGDLPPSTTAANFGKISADATPEDKALAIMNMIIGVNRRARTRQRPRVWPGKYRADGQAVAPVSIHAEDEAPRVFHSAGGS